MVPRKGRGERREWTRLPLHIPLFIRSRDRHGKDFLEFVSAINISAGGALVAMHGALRLSAQVLVEIPSAPMPASAPARKKLRNLRSRVVYVSHREGYNLVGLRFLQPLLQSERQPAPRRRKVISPV